jgi:hypothetical protein
MECEVAKQLLLAERVFYNALMIFSVRLLLHIYERQPTNSCKFYYQKEFWDYQSLSSE